MMLDNEIIRGDHSLGGNSSLNNRVFTGSSKMPPLSGNMSKKKKS